MATEWGITPKQSIEAECMRRGRLEVVAGCIDLLEGRPGDDELILALAGPAGSSILSGGAGGIMGYWPRVWAARGLLHVWDDSAIGAIVHGANDDSWRVREMVAKVVARHQVDEALCLMVRLRADPVTRVRTAAERALVRLTVY